MHDEVLEDGYLIDITKEFSRYSKHTHMLLVGDQGLEFTPLENGKCEYLVNYHDFGNLESVKNRVVNYEQFLKLVEAVKNNDYYMREFKSDY